MLLFPSSWRLGTEKRNSVIKSKFRDKMRLRLAQDLTQEPENTAGHIQFCEWAAFYTWCGFQKHIASSKACFSQQTNSTDCRRECRLWERGREFCFQKLEAPAQKPRGSSSIPPPTPVQFLELDFCAFRKTLVGGETAMEKHPCLGFRFTFTLHSFEI